MKLKVIAHPIESLSYETIKELGHPDIEKRMMAIAVLHNNGTINELEAMQLKELLSFETFPKEPLFPNIARITYDVYSRLITFGTISANPREQSEKDLCLHYQTFAKLASFDERVLPFIQKELSSQFELGRKYAIVSFRSIGKLTEQEAKDLDAILVFPAEAEKYQVFESESLAIDENTLDAEAVNLGVKALIDIVRGGGRNTIRGAIYRLGCYKSNSEVIVPLLMDFLGSNRSDFRFLAAKSLGRIGHFSQQDAQAIADLLTENDLGRRVIPEHVKNILRPILLEMVKDATLDGYEQAMYALEVIGDIPENESKVIIALSEFSSKDYLPPPYSRTVFKEVLPVLSRKFNSAEGFEPLILESYEASLNVIPALTKILGCPLDKQSQQNKKEFIRAIILLSILGDNYRIDPYFSEQEKNILFENLKYFFPQSRFGKAIYDDSNQSLSLNDRELDQVKHSIQSKFEVQDVNFLRAGLAITLSRLGLTDFWYLNAFMKYGGGYALDVGAALIGYEDSQQGFTLLANLLATGYKKNINTALDSMKAQQKITAKDCDFFRTMLINLEYQIDYDLHDSNNKPPFDIVLYETLRPMFKELSTESRNLFIKTLFSMIVGSDYDRHQHGDNKQVEKAKYMILDYIALDTLKDFPVEVLRLDKEILKKFFKGTSLSDVISRIAPQTLITHYKTIEKTGAFDLIKLKENYYSAVKEDLEKYLPILIFSSNEDMVAMYIEFVDKQRIPLEELGQDERQLLSELIQLRVDQKKSLIDEVIQEAHGVLFYGRKFNGSANFIQSKEALLQFFKAPYYSRFYDIVFGSYEATAADQRPKTKAEFKKILAEPILEDLINHSNLDFCHTLIQEYKLSLYDLGAHNSSKNILRSFDRLRMLPFTFKDQHLAEVLMSAIKDENLNPFIVPNILSDKEKIAFYFDFICQRSKNIQDLALEEGEVINRVIEILYNKQKKGVSNQLLSLMNDVAKGAIKLVQDKDALHSFLQEPELRQYDSSIFNVYKQLETDGKRHALILLVKQIEGCILENKGYKEVLGLINESNLTRDVNEQFVFALLLQILPIKSSYLKTNEAYKMFLKAIREEDSIIEGNQLRIGTIVNENDKLGNRISKSQQIVQRSQITSIPSPLITGFLELLNDTPLVTFQDVLASVSSEEFKDRVQKYVVSQLSDYLYQIREKYRAAHSRYQALSSLSDNISDTFKEVMKNATSQFITDNNNGSKDEKVKVVNELAKRLNLSLKPQRFVEYFRYEHLYKYYKGNKFNSPEEFLDTALMSLTNPLPSNSWEGFSAWLKINMPREIDLGRAIDGFIVSTSDAENKMNIEDFNAKKDKHPLKQLLFKTEPLVWDKLYLEVQCNMLNYTEEEVVESSPVEYQLGKSVWLSIFGGLADICTADDINLFLDQNFSLLSMVQDGKYVGFNLVYFVEENGEKILVLNGVEPSAEHLSMRHSEGVYKEVVDVLIEFAEKLNIHKVVQIAGTGTASNRDALVHYIREEIFNKSPAGELSAKIPLGGSYMGRHYYTLWESENAPKPDQPAESA